MSLFVPPLRFINNITIAQNCVITFTEEHFFKIGEIVSVRCSKPYGMVEINEKSSRVIALSSDTITLEIDTLNFTPFVYPAVGVVQLLAQVVPSGSWINPYEYTPTVTLEPVFDNKPS